MGKDVYDEENVEWMCNLMKLMCYLWNENVGVLKNSLLGKCNCGSVCWVELLFVDGMLVGKFYLVD